MLYPLYWRRLAREVEARGVLQGLQMMLQDHVGDLVAQHAGQLRFVVHVQQQAAGDEHVTARDGEGIDVVRIHHREMPGQVRPIALQGDPQAHLVHVVLHRGIVDGLGRAQQGGGGIGADLLLFVADPRV